MFRLLFCYIAVVASLSSIKGQCNGQSEVCAKKYDEVAFLTTHNAFNTGSESFTFPNQNYGIAQQLQDGVRAFMLDVYSLFGNTVVYHGSWTLGYQDIQNDLGEIKSFLDNNPNEVVTLILECYVDANTIENEISDAGLSNYLFTKVASQDWPTIQEMIDANERLVVFTDENDAGAGQGWYNYMWDHMVETHYSVGSPQDFTDDYNRGDSLNDLFIFNHFVTDATVGIGSESDAVVVNAYSFLMDRIANHFDSYHKFPNFITLDFYDQGNGLSVVEDLNAGYLSKEEVAIENWDLYPNPVRDILYISCSGRIQDLKVSVYNLEGRLILIDNDNSVDCSSLEQGVYIVELFSDREYSQFKIVVE